MAAIAVASTIQYIYKRKFNENRWQGVGNGICKIQVIKRGPNYTLFIRPQAAAGEPLKLPLSKEQKVHLSNGFVQIPLADNQEMYGIKFNDIDTAEAFYSKVCDNMGLPRVDDKVGLGQDNMPKPFATFNPAKPQPFGQAGAGKAHPQSLPDDFPRLSWRQGGGDYGNDLRNQQPPLRAEGYVPPTEAEPEVSKPPSKPAKPEPFVLEMPATVPDNFSEDFSPLEFAQWMKGKNHLPDDDCKVIIDSNISGLVFKDVDDNELKDYGFVKSGYYALRAVLKKVGNTKPDSVVVPAPAPVEEEPPTQDEQPLASDGGFNREKSARFPAMDRGTYKPMLKFKSTDEIAKLKPKEELIIPRLANGYYPMQGKKHGVCLIINNKTFKDSKHRERSGTDRDEYNLIETWCYLGYHVEVRREAKHREIMDIFYDIDELLLNINAKTKSQVDHDSFVCCILSHGNKFCFYSSDSKEVKIDYMERALGASTVLRDKPKMFFIQACQGEGLGTAPVSSKLHIDMSGLQADSEVQTSRRADIYISYATAQGDQSYRHFERGSWYIGVVCLTLCEESRQSSINELQKFINKGVADREDYVFVTEVGEYRQQPSCSDQLRRNVHFFFESTFS